MKEDRSGALCYDRGDSKLHPLTEEETREEAEQTLTAWFAGILPREYAEKRLELLYCWLLRLLLLALLFVPRAQSQTLQMAWEDNSALESGFVIERRRGTWDEWTPIGSVGQNITTFTTPGPPPGHRWCFRVRAFAGAESSAYSNTICHKG